MAKLTAIEGRQIISIASGLGRLLPQSNHDKPQRRIEKLARLGYVLNEREATAKGKQFARDHYLSQAALEVTEERAQLCREMAAKI